MQSLDAHTQPLYGRLQAAYGRTKVANGDFSKLPEHMQHAAWGIAARCVGNHSTLRMELHRTAGNAPALWSGKTSMMKGFGKERSGYLPSPNKPRTTLMTAGCFRGRVSWGSKKQYCFYLVAIKPRRHFHKGRVRLLLIFLPASEEQIDCLLFLLGVCRAEDECGGTDGDDV